MRGEGYDLFVQQYWRKPLGGYQHKPPHSDKVNGETDGGTLLSNDSKGHGLWHSKEQLLIEEGKEGPIPYAWFAGGTEHNMKEEAEGPNVKIETDC